MGRGSCERKAIDRSFYRESCRKKEIVVEKSKLLTERLSQSGSPREYPVESTV